MKLEVILIFTCYTASFLVLLELSHDKSIRIEDFVAIRSQYELYWHCILITLRSLDIFNSSAKKILIINLSNYCKQFKCLKRFHTSVYLKEMA